MNANLRYFQDVKKEVKQANPDLLNWAILEIAKIIFAQDMREEKDMLEKEANNQVTKEQVEKFWNLQKAIKRKTTKAGEVEAQKELLYFVQNEIKGKHLDAFGDYINYVCKWISAELVTNKFGKHLYVRLGA
jgi:hypothetical protein